MSGLTLKERLLKSTSASITASRKLNDTVLFPLASVRDLLRGHPIVRALGICENEVHSAVLEIHKRFPKCDQSIPVRNSPPPRCSECEVGFILLDSKEAIQVCDTCGVVQHRGTLNISREFTPPAETKRGCSTKLKGVPQWMFQCSLTDDSNSRNSKHWTEMQHFNAYVNLGADDLRIMDNILKEWTGGGFSSGVRVAACLLYLPLKEKFPFEERIRGHVRRKEELPIVRSVAPSPEFGCDECGKKWSIRKDARFCCKMRNWGKKQRRCL